MNNPTPESSGETIGHYRVIRPLGTGGMGEVLLAHDDRLRRPVAIKRIRSGAGADAAQRERLRREARAAAALSHPSVVQIYDIVEEVDGDSIVMEFVEGRTLASHLLEGSLDAGSAWQILLQVADGLGAAHARGLVHRDLKGENVIVAPDGSAKILDFGVAKATDPGAADETLTVQDAAVGTFRSMSPEQCEGRPVDARSDLFSLGVLMYEMLTGRTPFLGRTPMHTLANVVGFDPPSVRELNGSVPEDLSALVDELLAKDPEERPSSAGVVADRLERLNDRKQLAGIVLPRLVASPDSGVDPIRSVEERDLRSGALSRRRRPTGGLRSGAPGRRGWVWLIPVGVLAAVAAWLAPRLGSPERSGTMRIMVFPLVSSSSAEGAASVGEDVATVIGHTLDGVEPLQWLDGWPLLDPDARNNPRNLQTAAMAGMARDKGCRYYLWGRVIQAGDSAQVLLDLYDVRDSEPVARADARAGLADAWRAGLRAVNGLLPHLIETRIPDVEADFGNRPPEAVARFLLGEAALRRARYNEALGRFREAFALDSTFAVAGIRGAQAATWVHEPEDAAGMVERVLQLPLTPRSRRFASGVQAFIQSDAERAIENLEAAIEEDSLFAVAWAQLGETYRHLAPRLPPVAGRNPFARAETLDSLAGYVLFHRLEELARSGTPAEIRPVRDRFLAGSPDPELQAQIDVMTRCVAGGPDAADWSAELRRWPWEVLYAAAQLGMAGAQLPCTEALYREILVHDTLPDEGAGNRFWNSVVGLSSSMLARNRVEDARRLLDAAQKGILSFQALIDASKVGPMGVDLPDGDVPPLRRDAAWLDTRASQLTRWSELFVLVGAAHPELDDLGERGAADLRGLAGPELTELPYRTSIWLIGLWGAGHGRGADTERAATRLREIAQTLEDPFDAAYTERMATALDAHLQLARGDTAAALTALRALGANARPGVIYWEMIAPYGIERLVRARLEADAGQNDTALTLLRGFDEPNAQTNLLYLPAALKLCQETAAAAQRSREAARCTQRLNALGWTATVLED